jgi:hypothetical protein
VNRCLAEGRKSFLERYAGIESGRECERLAPALSAFVDGEGDAAQAVDLRMHLRQCLAWRAAVRGLHDASRPLTVVFPAAGLAVASGGAEQANGLFVRVYETLSMHVHERTANSFLRAQAIVRRIDNGASAALVKQPAQREVKTRTHAKPRSHARSSAARRRQAASRSAVSPASAPRASASPPAASTPRATVASQGSARAAGTSASSEFGFEGP